MMHATGGYLILLFTTQKIHAVENAHGRTLLTKPSIMSCRQKSADACCGKLIICGLNSHRNFALRHVEKVLKLLLAET